MRYRRLSFDIAPEAEEALAARLWELGTLGLELGEGAGGRLRVEAWFRDPPPPGLEAAADRLAPVASTVVEEADWMAAYRRQARPIRLGARLVVDPRDRATPPAAGAEPGRRWLHLPARRAFGTGSHASTRLVVDLLEELSLVGRSVLDLGTGSGVLAFAALAGGARRVIGLDKDPVAALIAGQNRAPNGLWPALAAGAVDCLRQAPIFDLALVNILPRRVLGDLAAVAAVLRPGGEAIFSGLLEGDRETYATRLGELGLRPRTWRREGDWLAVSARAAG